MRSRLSLLLFVAAVLGLSAASQWWGRQQEAALGVRLAALAAPGDLRMLSSDVCSICASARQWLGSHAVRFSECSIERDAACAAEFAATRAPGTPVFIVRGRAQVGFDPQRLHESLMPG